MEENKNNTQKQPEQKKKKKSDVLLTIALIVAIAVFCYAAFNLYHIYTEYKKGTDEYNQIEEMAVTERDADSAEVAGPNAQLKPPIEVDFDKLKSVNEDVVGWIYVDALPDISYPIVKGKDNQTYLHQTYEKNYNFAGTIFVDYENSGDFSDCNTLVYGHNMKNGSMFGHLKKFREDDKLYKQDKYFWILTPERNYRYEIITAYTTGVNSDTYTLFKGPGEEFEKYLETIKGYSEIQTDDTDLTIKDRIVTLSTCTGNESTRFVVQGKRVDAEDADGADGAATNTDSTADEENTDEISLDIAG
jgi:sortase B